ncbi:MAG: hypothetical protein EXS67_03010 [Candidatus Margulisbacteria bacterium]|nr:hypothetical protein [Candidatus Margulisiibacteriota bacterium]
MIKRGFFTKFIGITVLFFMVAFHTLEAQNLSQLSKLSDSEKMRLLNEAQSQSNVAPARTVEPPIQLMKIVARNQELSSIEKLLNQETQEEVFNPRISTDEIKQKPAEKIYQFGYDVFNNSTYSGSPYMSIPAGPDYVLGTGDTLQIRIWGKIEEQMTVSLDNNGQIYLPKVGILSLAGVRYGAVPQVIKRALSKYYVNFEVSATLGSMRSIKVFVLGEVNTPGAYDMSSMSTVMMSLYASGGLTKMGSLRKVQLIRNRHVIKTLDFYDYLMSGNRSQDTLLQNFDTVFIPVIGDVVKVTGLVKRPGIYELKGNETIYDAIETLAGGFGVTYFGKRIQVERILQGQKKVMLDLELQEHAKYKTSLKKEKLKNGDIITVLPISKKRFNQVTIQGNVYRPGTYEFRNGMTIGDLIDKADNLLDDTYLQRLELYREKSNTEREIIPINYLDPNSKKVELKEFDVLQVNPRSAMAGKSKVTIEGDVKVPGDYQLLVNMKILDLIYLAIPEKTAELDYAELVRKNPSGIDNIIVINLNTLKNNPDSASNLILQDSDKLFVRKNQERNAAQSITLKGEFLYPGTYSVRSGETLNEIIQRAGGVTQKAFLKGIIFKRKSVKDLEHLGQDKILIEEQKRLFYDQSRILSLNTKEYSGAYTDALVLIKTQVKQNEGRLVLDITSLEDIKGKNNVTLENNDEISLPEIPASVQIVGGVQQTSAHIFTPNQNLDYYINQSGGYSEFARRDDCMVIKSNGTIDKIGDRVIERGDTIYIPEEIKAGQDWLSLLVEISKVIANTVTALALYHTINP